MATKKSVRKPRRRAASSTELNGFVKRALELGAIKAKLIRPKEVETGQWVRWKCQFGCGGYGSSLVCPPHSPTPDQTRRMLDEYRHAVLFEVKHGEAKELAAKLEREVFLSGHYKALGLGAGPCPLCDECAFEEGCRHPDESRPAMEACGINVFATLRKHGFDIEVVRTRRDAQHYFGLVLIE